MGYGGVEAAKEVVFGGLRREGDRSEGFECSKSCFHFNVIKDRIFCTQKEGVFIGLCNWVAPNSSQEIERWGERKREGSRLGF